MTIAKLAWLSSPAAGRYVFNFQAFGSEELISIEVGPDHMRNILSDGVPLMLRQSFHRVPLEDANPLETGATRATLRPTSNSDISAPVQNRVPATTNTESANEHAGAGTQRTT